VTVAIVLAGGLGARLRAQVPDLPKPMAPVRGRPFLCHLLDHWIGNGISRFVLAISFRREQIRVYFGNSYRGVPLDYSVETEPLGTGGALLQALNLVGGRGPCLVLNGDTWFPVSGRDLLRRHRASCALLTLALTRVAEVSRYGKISLSHAGLVESVSRDGQGTPSLINAGVYAVDPRLLEALYDLSRPCSLEETIIPVLVTRGEPIAGLVAAADFVDIGIPADYLRSSGILP